MCMCMYIYIYVYIYVYVYMYVCIYMIENQHTNNSRTSEIKCSLLLEHLIKQKLILRLPYKNVLYP